MPSFTPMPSRPADLILAGATVLDPAGLRHEVDIHILEGTIVHVVQAGELPRLANEIVGYGEHLVIPAYTNSHHHFATGLLRLLPPGPSTRNQRERLEQVIWPFERQLTRDDVRLAVQLGLAEAFRAGTTVIVDHHVSGGCVPGILDVIAEEVLVSGGQAILCYEISDRDGAEAAALAQQENDRFLRSTVGLQQRLRGMVGLHALSTVGPDSLALAIDLAGQYDTGLHLHLGESEHDNAHSLARYGECTVDRLAAAGALTPKMLAAHAIHLTEAERDLLAEHDVMIAHCPRSNASNGVGLANLDALKRAGINVGLGGDGFTQDMRADTDLMPLLQRQEQRSSAALPPASQIATAIDGSATIVERLTGWRTGRVDIGYQANLVGLQYDPVLPLRPANVLWHYSRGFPGGIVRDVWSQGRRLLSNGVLTTLDEVQIRASLSHYANIHV